MNTEQNKEIVRLFIDDVVNGEHPEKMQEYISPDFVLVFPGTPPRKAADLPNFLSQMRATFPDYHIEVHELIAEGDTVVAITTQSGTSSGPYRGIPPTGKSYEVTGHVLYRLKDGKIAVSRPAFDRLSMLEQIGLIEAPWAKSERAAA
jgi:steroid delta-isomerase-like uncharacterized protein